MSEEEETPVRDMIISDGELAEYGKGSLFVDDATGHAYRLRDWGIDWTSEPFSDAPTVPDIGVAFSSGGFGAQHEMPYPVRVVWSVPRESLADALHAANEWCRHSAPHAGRCEPDPNADL